MSKTVLVVDDDDDVREALEILIQQWGFDVGTAGSGREALATMRAEQPALVLLDLTMPDMNGWAVRAEMLADPALARIPVVLLSGVADASAQSRALQTDDVLPKPVALDRLRDLLEAHLGPDSPAEHAHHH
jgi:CheY-like chemotaxis protein